MSPEISVVISTYNRPEQLKKAIASVQAQTFTDWEMIVVHDGAWTKEPYGVPDPPDFQDKRFRYSWVEHFGSDTKPKNHGIQEAKADLVAFLDDDNTWRPDHLQALYKVMEADPTLDVVYGDRWVHNPDDSKQGGIGVYQERFNSYALMRRNFIDTSDVLVKKSALQYVGGFDERYGKYIDWNLWVRLDKAGFRFQRVPGILTDYYLSPSSKSSTKLTKAEQELKDTGLPFQNIPDWSPIDLEIRLPFLGPVETPRVAIFSLTYDRLEYTKACFESLHKTAGYDFVHFIVDNGSTDGTAEWLKTEYAAAHPMKYIGCYNDTNRGISVASNQAIDDLCSFNKPDIIGKVDNDAFFLTDGWLKRIVELWQRNHRMAFSPYVQGLKDNVGGASRMAFGQVDGEFLGLTKHLGGISVFADAKYWKDFRHDEQMPLHGVQDVEFSQHLVKSGVQPCYLENYFVEHYKGTEQQHKDYPDYFERRIKEKQTRYAGEK